MNKLRLIFCFIVFFNLSCEERFLDLEPLDEVTESVYFTEPEHFEFASNQFYNGMVGLRPVNGSKITNFTDFGSDLNALDPLDGIGNGTNIVTNDDIYWTNTYAYLRDINILLSKVSEYPGEERDIATYVATAHFFRAWQYFFLLQRFGGVPIITSVLDLNSSNLTSPRNSRYEVVAQILNDLDLAIVDLPEEITDSDKGKISKMAAIAFKSKVLLSQNCH